MQPSPSAIQREFEALRDIRRRSSGPTALILDPDLPAQPLATAPPLSPQAWAATTANGSTSPTRRSEDESGSSDGGNTSADDPFHLFWVPARLHPELAPSEFRAFLKEHAHAPADGSGANTLSRSTSTSSTSGLGRKSSMLSRQYKPRDNDGVEEEHVVPLRRNKSIYQNEGPQLTINDLQKLEELADEASKSDDPTKLRAVIRRSLSLNVSPSFLDQMDDVPDAGDDADAPIIVPRPNQILRRSARTKIRKPGLPGDGGGHRFPATRRGSARAATVDVVASSPSDSSSGHGEPESHRRPPQQQKVEEEEEEQADNRRMTYTEESSIYDAYADSPEEDSPPLKATSPPPVVSAERVISPPPPTLSIPELAPPPQQPPLQSQSQPFLHQPQPQRHLSPTVQQQQAVQPPSRTPSPEAAAKPSVDEMRRPDSRSSVASEAPSFLSASSASAADKRKEKDKKSLWRKVGGGSDKGAKKNGKENKEREKEKERERESGFFGSLFGGGKKKQDDHAPSNIGGGAGPAAAAALLGASRSKGLSPSISPQLGNPYARYPIHVERAVYRLSHIKLANPRRPLYEQVLISNLMFWYLGVINKSQQGPGQTATPQAQPQAAGAQGAQGQTQDGAQAPPTTGSEKEHIDRELREREERERAEKERTEREERAEPRREQRRGSLTKAPPSGASAGRRAEMPVRGPQYGLQSQVIEQEYGPGLPPPMARTASAPPPGAAASPGFPGGYSRPHSSPPKQPPISNMYPQPDGKQNYYYGRSGSMDMGSGAPPPRSTSPSRSSASNLPPGAMAPLSSNEQLWLASLPSSNANPRSPSSPSPASFSPTSFSPSDSARYQPSRSARSPPPNHYPNHEWGRSNDRDGADGGKIPSRSLSANAVAPATNTSQYGGGLKKKVQSATAAPPFRRPRSSDGGEEEDVPLAVWQQQRRK